MQRLNELEAKDADATFELTDTISLVTFSLSVSRKKRRINHRSTPEQSERLHTLFQQFHRLLIFVLSND